MDYRRDIDGLRAVAIIPVVLFHAGLGPTGGFVGVDVFFVVSGFLITSILLVDGLSGKFGIISFYERRARRLMPPLFVVLAVTTTIAFLLMTPFDLEDYSKSMISTVLFAGNIWFFRQDGYFTEASELHPLLHTWSLGVEEQFYILFPIILFFILRFLSIKWVVLSILSMAMISFAWSVQAVSSYPKAAFYLPHFRAWELLIGSLLAAATYGRRGSVRLPKAHGEAVGLFGMGAILVAIISYKPDTPFPGLAALLPCLGAAVLLLIGSDERLLVSRLLASEPAVRIGKMSYSLYLWHWPILSFCYYRYGEIDFFLGVFCVLCALIISYLSWRYIEQPVRDRNRIGSAAVLFGSSGAAAVAILVGLALWKSEGFPGRYDPQLLALADPTMHLHDRRDCHFVTAERAAKGDLCLRGASQTTPSFVLAGDSHADALSPAIFGAAEQLGVSGYQFTDGGFAPLLGVSSRSDDHGELLEAFVNFLDERPNITTIIITRYWLHQFTGSTYRHRGDVWSDRDYDGSGVSYNPRAVHNGIARLSQRFKERKIVLLDDVPSGSRLHMRDNLRRIGSVDLYSFGLPLSEYQEQRNVFERPLINLANEFDNVTYYGLLYRICNKDGCPLFSQKTLLYRDGDHLSLQGAISLLEPAKEMLRTELLGRPRPGEGGADDNCACGDRAQFPSAE